MLGLESLDSPTAKTQGLFTFLTRSSAPRKWLFKTVQWTNEAVVPRMQADEGEVLHSEYLGESVDHLVELVAVAAPATKYLMPPELPNSSFPFPLLFRIVPVLLRLPPAF